MRTIRAKISFIMLIAAFLFCCVIIWLTYTTAEKYRGLITADCSYTVNSEFEYISDSIENFEEQARDLARLGGVYYRMSIRSVDIDRNSIMNNMDFMHNYIGGGVWFEPYSVYPDMERFCFYVYKDGDHVIYDEEFESDAYDYPRQEWYTDIAAQLKAGKAAAWHEPYVDEAGSHASMMTVGAGIYNQDGKLVGISTADLSIDFMLELSSDLYFTPGTSVSAVYEQTGELLSGVEPSALTGETLDYIRLFDNGIRLAVSIPKDELFSDVNIMVRNMAIVVFIIVLASFVLIYYMLDRFLNRPILTLAQKAGEIGKGNLNTVIEIKNNDELGQLGTTINNMTSDIKLYIESLNSITRENERIRSELEIAARIQREMLPAIKSENERYDIYAEMTPCREVGGDFYDAFLIGEKKLCVVIADVSGKGVPAALFMANAKTAVRTFAETGISVPDILMKANKQLAVGNKTRMFVTVFFGILNFNTGEFTYVNAGHNQPLIMRNGESFEYLSTEPGIVLAVTQNAVYTESVITLHGGDRLFLYTDGVTETFNTKKEMFGEARLQHALNKYKNTSIIKMIKEIKNEVDFFADGAPTSDDVTMLSVELTLIR